VSRTVLLIEPNYKNKYPPMGLMKLATYYRRCGDDVRFYKGDLKVFASRLLSEEFFAEANDGRLGKHFLRIAEFIRYGRFAPLDAIQGFRDSEWMSLVRKYRQRFKDEDFPRFDVVGVTTLFTFYWKETINTINYAKKFCTEDGRMLVGGIASSILPDQIMRETGIEPLVGLMNTAGILDADNVDIIDELPLDYSILNEIDYRYPASDAYFGYMTRGCPRNCAFCAVPKLEPEYKSYIGLKNQIEEVNARFGKQKNLLLMDNNVFASDCFDKIIDEIKECGFGKGATYLPQSEYEIAVSNLKSGYNIRAYTKKVIDLYDKLSDKLEEEDAGQFYLDREERQLLYAETAEKQMILDFDKIARPMHEKVFKRSKRSRYIDFNQGVDARLITDEKMRRLSEINIRPLRIAFDHYSMEKVYVKAITTAASHGITDLSNYLLYNFEDTPEELYYRMKINVDLCDELGVTIYSFPMKFHPIDDPEYFGNRNFIGQHWNRKFIRAVQAVLNATKGKIGRGKTFFEEAFGKDIDGYYKVLWMPEAFIIHRFKYKDNLTAEWWERFNTLNVSQLKTAKEIISHNVFNDETIKGCRSKAVREVLEYYRIQRDSH